MEAKLLKDRPVSNCDYLLVSLDDQSFSYLNDGVPVRMAFFVDDNDNLPWFKRKTMVAIIGKNLDFEKYKFYARGIFKKGLVDKSYLIDYINKMKKKFVQMAMQELDVLDIPGQITTKAMIENMPDSLGAPEEIPEEPKECITMLEAAKMLNVSTGTMQNFLRTGNLKGEHDGWGWKFVKSDVENLLKEKPEFLVKIWNSGRSYKKRGRNDGEIVFEGERYIHRNRAAEIINLSGSTIGKYAKAGLIRHTRVSGSDFYVSINHLKEIKANPPDWLKKSWSYFARKE